MTDSRNKPLYQLIIKGIVQIFLFVYFGSLIVPQWSMLFSSHFLDWFLALPVVVFVLLIIGTWSGISLWQAKLKNLPYNQQHKYFAQLAGLSLLWFCISVGIASGTQFAYLHKKFDAMLWKEKTSVGSNPYEYPSLRQRMINDVVENVLPESSKGEMVLMLGEADDTWIENDVEHALYFIGPEVFGVDFECLHIYYDLKGNFQEYEVFGNCG